ncbi:hormonally up-regulated neu tumor-associated kinase homolog A [Leucoraja erinacea]|uniref:hormonally up-regulated neu tumor-associated kinase homolog A n=1 Tax=Leucoraja erinaceus TaxID=7782 RepID=UPI002456684E|nr:hormonally up-regulated neu tumor-associated kinase homolog A [Leucoraja erinacea]
MPAEIRSALDHLLAGASTAERALPAWEEAIKDSEMPECFVSLPQDAAKSFSHTKRVGNYLVGKMINKGSFAKVMEGLHIPTGEKVAIKVIDKKKAKQDTYIQKNMKREPRIHQMIKHPNIVQLFETLETENSYYMAMELCQGGDLMDRICEKKKLEEREVRKYTRQILAAVEHLHRHAIVHRDLKIENFLLDENNNIKIVDFGLSNILKNDSQEMLNTQCGSPAYAAPELLAHKKYGPKVDVWSIGVSMFAMFTGTLPFTVEPFNIKQLHQKMVNGDMSSIPSEISSGAAHFMLSLLEPDPAKRPSVREAMEEKWINEGFVRRPLHSVIYKNRLRSDELNSVVLNFMTEKKGFGLTEIVNTLINNRPSPSMATYYLLVQKLARNQKEIKNKKKIEPSEWNLSSEGLQIHQVENNSLNKRPIQQRENEAAKQSKEMEGRIPDENLPSESQKSRKTTEQFFQEDQRTMETSKRQWMHSPTPKDSIKEEEIAISLEKPVNCFPEVSKFANRELVHLGLPSSRHASDLEGSDCQHKPEATQWTVAAKRQDQKEHIQETRLQPIGPQEVERNHKSPIGSPDKATPRLLLDTKGYFKSPPAHHETKFKDLLQAMEDQSAPAHWRCHEKDENNFAVIKTPQPSQLPKLNHGIFKDPFGNKTSWVPSPCHRTNRSSPFLVNGARQPLFTPSRQQALVAKSLRQSKEKTKTSLSNNLFRRNCIQLKAARKRTDLNLLVLPSAFQSKSDKKGEIIKLDFV